MSHLLPWAHLLPPYPPSFQADHPSDLLGIVLVLKLGVPRPSNSLSPGQTGTFGPAFVLPPSLTFSPSSLQGRPSGRFPLHTCPLPTPHALVLSPTSLLLLRSYQPPAYLFYVFIVFTFCSSPLDRIWRWADGSLERRGAGGTMPVSDEGHSALV